MNAVSPPARLRDDRTDEELIDRVRAGDPRAFELLHDRYQSLALHVARTTPGGNRAAAEDVVQEAFLTLWRRSDSFDPHRGSLSTWLTGLVRNRSIDSMRREQAEQRRRGKVEQREAISPAVETTASAIESSNRARAVRAALESLPRDQYRVIDMAYYLELSQSRIAELMGCPLGTIKGRNRLGLAKLRETLEEAA